MTAPVRSRLPREQRREQLLDVALGVIVGDGFGALSMEGIARRADIAKTVVYDQFGSVQGLLRALLLREQDRIAVAIAEAFPDATRAADPVSVIVAPMTSLLESVKTSPDTWRLILLSLEGSPAGFREALELHRSLVLEQMHPQVARMLLEAGLGVFDIELVSRSILATLENAVRLMLTDSVAFPSARIIDFVRMAAELISVAPPNHLA